MDFSIFFVEQNGSDPFNRAKLMNVGIIEALKSQLTQQEQSGEAMDILEMHSNTRYRNSDAILKSMLDPIKC